MFVLDSHCDTPSQILRGRDLAKDNSAAHVDFPKLRRGGVDGAFFAIYVPAALSETDALEHAEKQLEAVEAMLHENSDKAALTVSEQQAYENKSKGIFSVFLGLENGSLIGNSIDRVKWLYDKGIRYITLCHSLNNQLCDSCGSDVKKWGGLSPFGKEVIEEMNRLGILIDVSHISDDSFYDVLKYSKRPVVATHSCCRALAEHPRNMTDDMIRALAAAGGVIQINFYPVFLDDSFSEEEMMTLPKPSYKRVIDHIDHVVKLVGVDHVGIGSDFDGIDVAPDGLEDISMMPRILFELRRRGYTEEDIEKITSLNFFSVFASSDAAQS